MRIKLILAAIVLVAVGVVVFLFKAGVIGSRERVSVIAETPNIVEAVEQIQELCTEYYYDEVMLKDSVVKTGAKAAVANTVNTVTETASNWFSNVFGKKDDKAEQKSETPASKPVISQLEKELVVIVKVTCRVGWDLKEIVDNDGMQVNGDTLFIDLPKAKFLETIANPTDINIFVEDGEWEFPGKLQGAIRKAKEIVQDRAMADGIIEKADVSGRKILSNLFSTMGFKVFFMDELPDQDFAPSTPASKQATPAGSDSEEPEETIEAPAQEVPAA
ncbi:MAG: DUF4230 domain-containing protein [Bacteroidales bacterium]|nr:DUF4230 domain-containing protein [Bacteroidales bacterium]